MKNPGSTVYEAYADPSLFLPPHFVTVKLSGKDTYTVWKTQILHVLEIHLMYGFIDGQFPRPAGNGKGKVEDLEAWRRTDSLVKLWIFASLSEEAVNTVVNHIRDGQNNTEFSAKDLWDELQCIYGPSAASTSNPSCIADVGSHNIGPNIVTVKLSGKNKYNLWRLQMECLLKSQHMVDFIRCTRKGKVAGMEAVDSLVKGWILGSLSEEVARKALNHLTHKQKKTDFTAKDLWDELQRIYGTSVREQAAEMQQRVEATPLIFDFGYGPQLEYTRPGQQPIQQVQMPADSPTQVPVHLQAVQNSTSQESALHMHTGASSHLAYNREIEVTPTQAESVIQVSSISEENVSSWARRSFYDAILEGNTRKVIDKLKNTSLHPWAKIANNGNTVLHIAVSSSTKNHELLKELMQMIPPGTQLRDVVNSDGSTPLHVAAISGNIEAVNMLVERNPELLSAKDKEGHIPLALSISNMHTITSDCLFDHMKGNEYGNLLGELISGGDLVVLAISCQDFSLANRIINCYPRAIYLNSDDVLTALAQNFPRELNIGERGWKEEFDRIVTPYYPTIGRVESFFNSLWCIPLAMILTFFIYGFFKLINVFNQFYNVLASRGFVKDAFRAHVDATDLLHTVCQRMPDSNVGNTYHHEYYTNSIFEATRQNASTFIRVIMKEFSDAIWSVNEDGQNFIQYSVINRSEKIYNLLYEMSEHKDIYKTIKDSFGNNLLHLAARLAPTNKLNLISGAALQIQRELQWFKEVERFVCPLNRIQKNLDDETPEMVFTREHKDLVIEGENWIKKTAESCTITAALIITIVFAAAITVPGGNNQESGLPIFTNKIAFTIFAISDAISLFTAVTSLLMFLSILTTRFAEQDFLFKLPMKLIIGLTMLFLSTTAMIIAFGATLFLVFGQSNLSMLIPIGALTCLPIASFVTLQFPLIVELISATYCGGIFVREEYDYFY